MKPLIHSITLLLTSSSLLLAAEATKPDTAKPNILFLLADDWAWPHASCLGDPVVKTPTFDRVAKEGVMFMNAHSASPSCSPSRAAVLTGQWPWRLSEGANLSGWLSARFDVYPELLEKSGYFVGMMLKGYSPAGLFLAGQPSSSPALQTGCRRSKWIES
jgi:N-sulfoglucosamine sulfohydrolase